MTIWNQLRPLVTWDNFLFCLVICMLFALMCFVINEDEP